MAGFGELAQAGEGWDVHVGQSFAGTEAGNQRRPNPTATLTSRISTGTWTSGPMTAAKATGDARTKADMSTAIEGSQFFHAAGQATVVVLKAVRLGNR